MTTLIALIIAVLLAVFGFQTARRFVRDRLRFVDAAQTPAAPWIAGGVATILAAFVAVFLPLVSWPAVLAFGAAIAAGVAVGARDVKTGHYLITDGK